MLVRELLRWVRVAGYAVGKSAFYELIAAIRPPRARPEAGALRGAAGEVRIPRDPDRFPEVVGIGRHGFPMARNLFTPSSQFRHDGSTAIGTSARQGPLASYRERDPSDYSGK